MSTITQNNIPLKGEPCRFSVNEVKKNSCPKFWQEWFRRPNRIFNGSIKASFCVHVSDSSKCFKGWVTFARDPFNIIKRPALMSLWFSCLASSPPSPLPAAVSHVLSLPVWCNLTCLGVICPSIILSHFGGCRCWCVRVYSYTTLSNK